MADISKIKLGNTNYNIKDAVLRNKLLITTPEIYGAVGDGTTNDTTAFTNALNSGKAVYVSKTYKLNNIEVSKNNLYVFGHGTLDFSASKGGLKITGNNNTFDGVEFIGNEYSSGSLVATKTFLHFVGDNNVATNCKFSGGNCSGIQITGNSNEVTYCYFNRCNSHPADGADWGSIWFTNDSEASTPMYSNNIIVGNTIEEFDYSGICMIGKYKNTTISKNKIKSTNTQYTMGIYMFAGCLEGCIIDGNNIETIYNEGIVLTESVANYISNGVVICNNILKDCSQRSIAYAGTASVNGGNALIENNVINGVCAYPIQLAHMKKGTISNNFIKTSSTTGACVYAIEDVENLNACGNTIEGNSIGIMTGADSIINNNILKNNTTGVVIFAPDTIAVEVSNNNFIGCTIAISGNGTTAPAYSLANGNTFKNCTTLTRNAVSVFGFEKNVAVPSGFTGTLSNGSATIRVYAGRANDGWIAIPIGGTGSGALSCTYNQSNTTVTVNSTSNSDTRTVMIIKAVNG